MPQISSSTPLNSSRLIRLLAALEVADVAPSPKNFGDWLGGLLDFSDSIILSATHGDMRDVVFEPENADWAACQAELLKVRGALVEAIVKSTSPSASSGRIKWPQAQPDEGVEPGSTKAFEPYQRFYVAHQNDMRAKLAKLRFYLRDACRGVSKPLAQLAVLDEAFEDTLQMQSKQFFAVIPKLLLKRYQLLWQRYSEAQQEGSEAAPDEWLAAGGWLAQFREEVQGVLLAELEVRLQPILGLLEALGEEVKQSS